MDCKPLLSCRAVLKSERLEEGESKAMVHVTYMSSAKNEQSVVAEVDGVQVLVNLPFILKLVNFFAAALKPLSVGVVKDDAAEVIDESAVSGTEITTESGQHQMKISVTVTRPCIALIETPGIPDPKILVLEVRSISPLHFRCNCICDNIKWRMVISLVLLKEP